MTIVPLQNTVKFSEIHVGDCFLWIGTYFMRIPLVEDKSVIGENRRNVVCLYDGSVDFFNNDYDVIPVDIRASAKRG